MQTGHPIIFTISSIRPSPAFASCANAFAPSFRNNRVANLHTCLGVNPPALTLSDFINHRVETLDEALVPTPQPGLSLMAGAMDLLESGNPTHTQKQRLFRHLARLPADYIVLDLGAGTSTHTMDFFLLAEHGILVVVPEPTSVENAYRFLKAAYLRRFRTVQKVYDVGHLIDEAVKQRNQMGIRTPRDLVNEAKRAPGRLSFGYGSGTARVVAAAFTRAAGIDVLAVPTAKLQERLKMDAAFAARFYKALGMLLSFRLRKLSTRVHGHDVDDESVDECDLDWIPERSD